MRRNVSSQFSNYVERQRLSNSRIGKQTHSSHFSDQSNNNKARDMSHLANKMQRVNSHIEEKGFAAMRTQTEASPTNKPVRENSFALKGRR